MVSAVAPPLQAAMAFGLQHQPQTATVKGVAPVEVLSTMVEKKKEDEEEDGFVSASTASTMAAKALGRQPNFYGDKRMSSLILAAAASSSFRWHVSKYKKRKRDSGGFNPTARSYLWTGSIFQRVFLGRITREFRCFPAMPARISRRSTAAHIPAFLRSAPAQWKSSWAEKHVYSLAGKNVGALPNIFYSNAQNLSPAALNRADVALFVLKERQLFKNGFNSFGPSSKGFNSGLNIHSRSNYHFSPFGSFLMGLIGFNLIPKFGPNLYSEIIFF